MTRDTLGIRSGDAYESDTAADPLPGRPAFTAQAKCRGVGGDVMFPSDWTGLLAARALCAECPAKDPCLEYALDNHIDHGVWAGTSERERRRMRARRGAAA